MLRYVPFVSRDYASSMCLHSYLCSCNSYLSKFLCTFLSGQCRCTTNCTSFFVPVLVPARTNDTCTLEFLFSLATTQPFMSKPDLLDARIEINITTTICNFTYHSGDNTSCNPSALHFRSCNYYNQTRNLYLFKPRMYHSQKRVYFL